MFKNINNYRNKIILLSVMWALLLIAVFTWSVLTGQYPLTLKGLLSGDTMSIMVFKRLRLPRAIMGIIGGFGLSISGYVYQMLFKNPLASPDVVGVSSGASAGAAFAIVAVSSLTPVVSISAFAGGIIALIITLLVAYLVPGRNSYTIVLAGIAIHSVAQTILMFLYTYIVVFNVMGRDYDAAVLSSGVCGFGMGATPNAMANMQAVCEKYAPSVNAFLLVPLVGSLFADFLNSLAITFFINIL